MRATHPGHGAQLAIAVVHAEQLGHEVADVGAVGFAKALLDKAFKRRSQSVVGQRAGQCHLRCFGLTEAQGQGDVPVKIGHGQNASLNRFEASIGGIS